MVGINGIKYKLMPTSLEVDLEKIKDAAKTLVTEFGGENKEYSEESIAFGLKAIIVFFFYPDNKDIELLESKLNEIENVSSIKLIDMRKIA